MTVELNPITEAELNPITEAEAQEQWKDYCMDLCRKKRDRLIAATDYINFSDVTVSDEKRTALLAYRQELRDFPATFEALFDAMTDEQKSGVTDLSMPWPTKP